MQPSYIRYNYTIVQPNMIPLQRTRFQSQVVLPFDHGFELKRQLNDSMLRQDILLSRINNLTISMNELKNKDQHIIQDQQMKLVNIISKPQGDFVKNKQKGVEILLQIQTLIHDNFSQKNQIDLYQLKEQLEEVYEKYTDTPEFELQKNQILEKLDGFCQSKLKLMQPVTYSNTQPTTPERVVSKSIQEGKKVQYTPFVDSEIKNVQQKIDDEQKKTNHPTKFNFKQDNLNDQTQIKTFSIPKQNHQDEIQTAQKDEGQSQITNKLYDIQKEMYLASSSQDISMLQNYSPNGKVDFTTCEFYKIYQKSKGKFFNKSFQERTNFDIKNRQSKLANYQRFLKENEKSLIKNQDPNVIFEIQKTLGQVKVQLDLEQKRKDHIEFTRLNKNISSVRNSPRSAQMPSEQLKASKSSQLDQCDPMQYKIDQNKNKNITTKIKTFDTNYIKIGNIEKILSERRQHSIENSNQNSQMSQFRSSPIPYAPRKPDVIKTVRDKIKQIITSYEPKNNTHRSKSQMEVRGKKSFKNFSSYKEQQLNG